MSLINRFLRQALQPFSIFWRCIWKRLDVSFKRMCVMASLHAVLLQCQENECKQLSKLNNSFELVKDQNAMRFPTLIGPFIWKGILPIEKIDLKTDRYFRRVLRMTPCWLLYTEDGKFIEELRELFYHCARERGIAI